MPSPKLSEIIKLMELGTEFTLTDSQYKSKTGLHIPKDNSYLIHRSAIAKRARRYGYKLAVHEKEISFEKEKNNEG